MNIDIRQVNKSYPTGKQALRDINLTLQTPSLIGLLGPNGAGKSTLMRLMVAGLLPTSGTIEVDGSPLLSIEKSFKSKLGYLPQSFGLFDELTVAQFLDYFAALKGIRHAKSEIDRVIEATGLENKRKSSIRTLSGGQRQRVGIAQALLGEPRILIFDEPTVGLDPEERIRFRNLFSHLAQQRIVLLSTHIIEDVQSVCDRLIIIHRGGIRFDGSPAELIKLAQGHVDVFTENGNGHIEDGVTITSRVNSANGISCRAVGDKLPVYAEPTEPTLEDAYLYLIGRKEGA